MAIPGNEQIADYLHRQGLIASGAPVPVTQLSQGFDSSIFQAADDEREPLTIKYFAPAHADAARREAEALRICGAVGLAPSLVAFEEIGATVGGPLVIYRQPVGLPLGGRPLTDEEVNGWMFLLLTLHHLAPEKVQLQSTLSPGVEQWWDRMQPLWNDVRAAYPETAQASLIDALDKLRTLVDVHVRTNRDLWVNVPRRPCHGDPVPVNVIGAQGRFVLVDWGGFGLGDIALEIARAAALAALQDEITSQQYVALITDYLSNTKDLKDPTLEQRVHVFASVFPYGFTLFMLSFLARLQQEGPETMLVDDPAEYRGRGLMAVARSLTWIQDALGVEVAAPADVLAPFGQTTSARG
jgi:hypothetical protein